MIAEIADLLEALGYEPVEKSTAAVSYRVRYFGMTAADSWTPEVREMYAVELWINEKETIQATQIAVQTACRQSFIHVSELLDATVLATTVNPVLDEYDGEEPTATLIFQTVTPRRNWDD